MTRMRTCQEARNQQTLMLVVVITGMTSKAILSFQYLPARDADTSKAFVVAEEEKFVGGARKQLSRREIAKSQEGIVQTASALLVWLKSMAHLAGTAECLGHDLHLSQDHSTGTPTECLIRLLPIQLS
jgi:hypothetical protein